jgi:hypothetical protein
MKIREMGVNRMLRKHMLELTLLLILGPVTNANAGFLGLIGDSWKEEALQHDGSKIVVERSQKYFLQGFEKWPRVKEHSINFALPGSNKDITWISEYSEDIDNTNFDLLALHIFSGIPYVVASPNLCLSYNKWGRPNPPYVFFKYDGVAWQRIPIDDFPSDISEINLLIDTAGDNDAERAIKTGFISADNVKVLNSGLRQAELKSILREPQKLGGTSQVNCPELVQYKCGWGAPGEFNRKYFERTCK